MENKKQIAILGGGPSGMFMFKRLIESGSTDFHLTLFERKKKPGAGMPYSLDGANTEHVTNVSSNEIPELVSPITEWIKTVPKDTLDKFHIDPARFNEYKVLPRLLFGKYLTAQFHLLEKKAKEQGVSFEINYNAEVTDIKDDPEAEQVTVEINAEKKFLFDQIVICTGHHWLRRNEGKIPGIFDSPYPPAKLAMGLNHAVAIKGSSLTAVDAIKTLARYNGEFRQDADAELSYHINPDYPEFKLIMHTRNGLLPAVRFHLEDSHLSNDALLSDAEIKAHIAGNGGFLSLDYVFEHDFKLPIRDKQPDFYEKIKYLGLEEFVNHMMDLRERLDPFQLLKAEYAEAEKSIKRKESIYWKEMLGVLSFALNYPAKYLSAEDMQRLKHSLSPLISIVIAYIPQSSAEELLAMHRAGVLELIPVGEDSEVIPQDQGGVLYKYTDEEGQEQAVYYQTFVDCVGQPHLSYQDFPFRSLLEDRTIAPAKLKFRSETEARKMLEDGYPVLQDRSGDFYLKVSGIAINDYFQIVDDYGALNDRIYVMAVPYIGGYNPDYSGLDFSEAASAAILKRLLPQT